MSHSGPTFPIFSGFTLLLEKPSRSMDRKHMSSKRKSGSIGEQDRTARCRKRREQRLTVPKPTTAVFSEALLHDALMHISRNDPLIKPLIDKHGVPTTLLPKSCDSLFGSLARSVCSQQYVTCVLQNCTCSQSCAPIHSVSAVCPPMLEFSCRYRPA